LSNGLATEKGQDFMAPSGIAQGHEALLKGFANMKQTVVE